MKKRILSLILALSMVLSVLPLGAFAEGSTNSKELVMGANGLPDCSNNTSGNGWEYSRDILILNYGAFDFSSTHPQGGGEKTTTPVACAIVIESGATITGGIFTGGSFEQEVTNYGTISGGTFQETCSVINWSTIENGTFSGTVQNTSGGRISGGTFSKTVQNVSGEISGGTFQSTCSVTNNNTIGGGTFEGTVTNSGTITGNGTFNGTVTNSRYIENGTFNGTVTNSRYIKNGTFNGTVTNNDAIYGGIFAGSVNNSEGCHIYGGVFNGKTGLDGVTVLISITVASNAKITEVNGVSADWKPYVVVTSFTETREVIITADTEIFSLNGYPIDGSPYKSSYEGSDYKTVKFTELGVLDNEMVLNGAITHGGDLVMENGYPKASIGGKYSCSGTGWEYSKKDTSNPNGKLILKGKNREFDFSLANPQDTTNKTPADSAVKCAIESGAKITGGTFEGSVKNHWYITDGIFYGTVTNLREWFDGYLDAGMIQGGTFNRNVENNTNTVIKNGTFNETVTNNAGYIYDGTFKGDVINNNRGEIKGGTFNKKVTNNAGGEISGGTFAGSVENNWNIYGGVFNGKTGLDGVTGVHSITVATGAKIEKVNGVSAKWDPHVVVTESTKNQEVTITASTEIYSLNDQPIDESSYPDTTDKKTVTFTMPGENVVLNRTAELEVVGGEIESGETAEGSGRVRIGGKVEVTTKDKTQDFVGWTIAPEGIELRHDDGSAVDLTSERTFSFMMPDVSGGKLTLTANYQPFRTSLLMNADGTVNLEHVDSKTYDGNETCKGDGWNVFNRGTLILEKWTYDFQYTAPTEKTGTLEAVTCGVQNKGGTIENGVFRNMVLNEVGGTITGGTFAAGLVEMPGMTSGTVTGGVFNGKTGLTNAHHVTVTDGSVLKVNGEDPLKVDETTGAVTTGTAWDLYAYAGTTVTITADTDIFSLNGQPIGTGNCNSSYPDENDKTTVTFTMPDKDVVLNEEINYGDLVMENGYPKASKGGTIPCKGDGWEYIKNDPTNGDMLLLTGSSQTGGLYDFSAIGDGSAVECNVFVGKPTAITGGEFNGKVINNSHILGGTFHGEVDNMGPGRIVNGTFKNSVENNGMIENGTFHDEVKNNGTINDGTFKNSVENNGMIENGTFHDEVKNNGTINDGAFNGKVENNSAINGGTFNSPVDNTTMGRIENGTFNDAVENNGTIENGTFHGEVKNNGTINGGVFNGAVTGSGTVSGNITGSGTLNGEPITKTPEPEPEPKPEPKPEPEPEPEPKPETKPEPTTYTVTVIGGTIDGKTSVSAKENDTLTVVLDQNDIPDGMTFDLWSISSDKLSGDINVDYRAEAMTFQMPAEDVTIRAQYRSAEIIEDAAPSPLATAATVAVGGAAAGIVVWQGVSLGVDLYLTSALPQGVPVPTDRRALALLLWETAGKPEVALPTLYGDVPAEEIELQKATRWAVQNGLMDAADKKDASFFDPDHYVTKMDVFGAWLRLKKLLGTT